ncbi:hypothetical protein [Rodentibacter heidelbergensis]|uniref:Uncharacterized protein n=1 Tax=Rodentibacter heidelbergensis TaxID=1908258 RepID=A0A1V3I7M7_9PAST|nr:hypothetical protein [Rodentibacter heidelbergensis]OOF36042.1 hypothetical protein BKK48_07970 [Rodentibacter heidelbergensis]
MRLVFGVFLKSTVFFYKLRYHFYAKLSSPYTFLNTIESAVKNDSASERLKAANVMSVAAQGYNLYDAVNKMLKKYVVDVAIQHENG